MLGVKVFSDTDLVGAIAGIPAALVYLLYHPVVELAMGGQTPGKRMAGVRIVTRTGQPPPVTAVLIRNAFRLVDSFPAFYTVGLLSTILTRDSVRIGDLAAGTVLVYLQDDNRKDAERLRQLAQQTRLPMDLAELVGDLLARWPQLDPGVRRDLARTLLARAGQAENAGTGASDAHLHSALRQLLEATGR